VIEHPVQEGGLVHDDGSFRVEAALLNHSVDTLGWRVQEADVRKFDREKLERHGIRGPLVRQLAEKGELLIAGRPVKLDEVSHIRPGDAIAVIMDTLPCAAAVQLAHKARLLLCESTYLEEHRELARRHDHLTAKQAAQIAQEAEVDLLVLTHFSGRYLDTRPFREEAAKVFPRVEVAEDLKVIPLPR
jgi:ribonuclease Z